MAAPEKGENIDDPKSLLLHDFGAGLDVLGGEDSDPVDRRSGEVDVVHGDFRCEGGVCVDVGNVGEVIGRESGRFWDANRGWCFEVGDCFEADK